MRLIDALTSIDPIVLIPTFKALKSAISPTNYGTSNSTISENNFASIASLVASSSASENTSHFLKHTHDGNHMDIKEETPASSPSASIAQSDSQISEQDNDFVQA